MAFVSAFVREQRRYTKNELASLFAFSEDEVQKFIRTLKAYGILKTVRNRPGQADLSDLVDDDLVVVDEDIGNAECFYVFTFVGVLTVGERVIKCYPKYIFTNRDPLSEMKQVLKVLRKYGTKEQIVDLFNGDGDNASFNLLAVMLFLLEDYHQYGLYTNTEDVIEQNAEGTILWEQTIDKGFAIISHDRPFYVDYYTRRIMDDEEDFFYRLHKCILTLCSKQLASAGLLDLFELVEANISEEELLDFGDTEYLLYRLDRELNVQFDTHKLLILKTLYAFLSHGRSLAESYGVSMYGTTSFYHVWEVVCAEVFGNQPELFGIIEHPLWSSEDEEGEFTIPAAETLIPDIVQTYEVGGERQFLIMDAKYYCIEISRHRGIKNIPGVGDVTKQYLYQLAYREYFARLGIHHIRNVFLMPTEAREIKRTGRASMQMLDAIGLEQIGIYQLPAAQMYDLFLRGERLGIDVLIEGTTD